MESQACFLHFMKSDQKVDRIMAFRTGKAQEQRKVNLQGTVMSGQMEKCISIIVFIQVAVPAPGSIGVGIMTGGALRGGRI